MVTNKPFVETDLMEILLTRVNQLRVVRDRVREGAVMKYSIVMLTNIESYKHV